MTMPKFEPVAFLFQHEDTGLISSVDVQQVEWGFEKNNPRHINCGPLHTADQLTKAYEAGKREQAAELAAARAEIKRLKREDFREMHEMLRAMQAGELTVSRGLEILNIWWAGNWNDNMLPPVRQDLIEENAMPVEIIDRLNQQLAAAESRLHDVAVLCATVEQERDQLKEQLAAALATCKLKDEALNDAIEEIDSLSGRDNSCDPKSSTEDFEKALDIQPDDSALRAWLGAPQPCRSDGRCQYAIDHGAEGLGHCPAEKCCMPLYSPKGLK